MSSSMWFLNIENEKKKKMENHLEDDT